MVLGVQDDMTLEEIQAVRLKAGARVLGSGAGTDEAAWGLVAVREGKGEATLRHDHWHIAQDLAAMPDRAAIVYSTHYRRAIV